MRPSWKARLLLVAFGLLLTVVVGEAAARVWVAWRWPPERVAQMTTHSTVRGRFASHSHLPFVLNPDFAGHNRAGFRGPELAAEKPPGVRRVACIGASTTYGLYVAPEEAYPAQLAALLSAAHGPWEAINAGVPGWVSVEMLIDLQLRVLPMQPDVVVVLEGRNETFPQAYEGFRPDYTHYRRPGFAYAVSNYAHKEVFAWSRLAMLACTLRGERFGWSETEEHPLYGGIFWENRPTLAQAEHNLARPERSATWRANLTGIVALCRARGVEVVFCTMAFVPDKLALDELPREPGLGAVLAAQVERNNAAMREVAAALGVPVAEGARLAARPELFHDDCHMNAEGHRERARIVFETLAPRLGGR
ncbi:MAG TPA: SGNH/GDSL hydrolase family protein [Planctomycetota bacterium]|nr:SGNH/GDSL hydrolase family protein [Planctomycetota bacterium]